LRAKAAESISREELRRRARSASRATPSHRVAIAGNARKPCIYDVQLDRPMNASSYQSAFETARSNAKVIFRFYDARHTFVTRLAENPAVSEETIRQLAGHVSPKMLGRYAHIRAHARRAAIATLETADFSADGAQNWAQSADSPKPLFN
jgi:integrase